MPRTALVRAPARETLASPWRRRILASTGRDARHSLDASVFDGAQLTSARDEDGVWAAARGGRVRKRAPRSCRAPAGRSHSAEWAALGAERRLQNALLERSLG